MDHTEVSAKCQGLNLNLPMSNEAGPNRYAMLSKDNKPICLALCSGDVPSEILRNWSIADFRRCSELNYCDYSKFQLIPVPQNSHQKREWWLFMSYLRRSQMVAVVKFHFSSYYIYAQDWYQGSAHCVVFFPKTSGFPSNYEVNGTVDGVVHNQARNSAQSFSTKPLKNERVLQDRQGFSCSNPGLPFRSEDVIIDTSSNITGDSAGEVCKGVKVVHCTDKKVASTSRGDAMVCSKNLQPDLKKNVQVDCVTSSHASLTISDVSQKNFLRTDPSYLNTLSQTHSGWIFGAIAELVDNSRDAHSTRLDIFIEHLYSKIAGKKIPVLTVADDGDGMSHIEIVKMLSFGHKQATNGEDQDRIGRFGIGFKTGSMKLGRDALVLTQSSKSRSVAFLSQSYNEINDNIEIPIVSYIKNGRYMEIDLNVQSEESANFSLNAIKEHSPFNEYFLGEQFGLFVENGTGTRIFIWNLDKWGSDYTLEWAGQADNTGCCRLGDILIRSRRIRSRLGQISHEVPLDYSLRAYLELIFLNPRMKIYVQGSLVKSRPLAKMLSETVTLQGSIMARPIQFTLGTSEIEWERMNCGVFLYWNGRLIEAYKRVGGMRHNADVGRGVLGVVDVTSIMDIRGGQVWVLNNKQGFQDCEVYAKLEDWLGRKMDEYLDENLDKLRLVKGDKQGEPDNSWVQCDKCRKWRVLNADFDSQTLPLEWFCFMPPFNGSCDIPEQQMEPGVVTVAATRSQFQPEKSLHQHIKAIEKVSDKITCINQGSRQSPYTLRDKRKAEPSTPSQTDQSDLQLSLRRTTRRTSANFKNS